jgi:hypothetical protein
MKDYNKFVFLGKKRNMEVSRVETNDRVRGFEDLRDQIYRDPRDPSLGGLRILNFSCGETLKV